MYPICANCGAPVTECTMPYCNSTGWVHLRSRKHQCELWPAWRPVRFALPLDLRRVAA